MNPKRHQAITDSEAIIVIFLICQLLYIGYSIHGNESSGTGAIALAYPRCCRKSRARKNTRKYYFTRSSFFNPDGLHFSTWVNSNKSTHLVTDSNERI
jgi:hypothetical protein